MTKWVPATDYQIQLNSLNKSCYIAGATITAPLFYSFLDLLDMIKILTNYGDKFDWDFLYWTKKEKINLLSKYIQKEFDNVKFGNIWTGIAGGGGIECIYGYMQFDIGVGRNVKQYKAYPIMYTGTKFPSEEEYNQVIAYKPIKYNDVELKIINEKLKEHFNKKYKISNEIDIENSSSENPYNKLIKK